MESLGKKLRKKLQAFAEAEGHETSLRHIPPSEFVENARKVAAPALLGAGLILGSAPAQGQHKTPSSIGELIDREARKEHAERSFSEEDIRCLTDNIYHEARGEVRSVNGVKDHAPWYAVMLVTFGRKLSPEYPKDVCGVVYQPLQFSWTFDKKILAQPINNRTHEEIRRFVEDTIRDHSPESLVVWLSMRLNLPPTTLFYKRNGFEGSERVRSFFSGLQSVGVVGNHEFFVKPPKPSRRR